jgi:glycosyltransferase involved in cell wall biosynthesis
MNKLSAYVLTFNSEKYLSEILTNLSAVADEILVVDSGSTDDTAKIAASFEKVRFITHPFSDFKSQRTFAVDSCNFDYVLFLDSDEIPDAQFIDELLKLKSSEFKADAYEAERNWNVLGKDIRVLYPITSPDFPIRLYNRQFVSFVDSSLVHETPSGYRTKERLMGSIRHITFPNRESLNKKLGFYTDIAARDLILKNKKISLLKALGSGISAFIKWYFIKKGFLDGLTGIYLGIYAFRYSYLKYIKALRLKR